MVRLDRITLQGFKSFSGKITIPFPVGFNCICGPNGSGKSNIVDALMFILGTSSARSIRAPKLQNLLFNGGKDRKPADYCEVSLYLNNEDGKIPGNEKEVKITRKITRSGISVYKLSGKTVTKSKVIDLLSNANLSAEGYNIIMQGDVTKIIEMNPIERRGVIDEVSGISEFDEKREKATGELEKVETWVRENMIVVAEKQRLVARLKEEKENAEKYDALNKKLRKYRASLLKKRIKEIDENLKEFDSGLETDRKKFEGVNKNLEIIEKELEEKEKGITERSDEIIKRSRDYEIVRKIESINAEILRKKDKIEMNEREIRRIDYSSPAIKAILSMNLPEIHGTVSSLITIPKKYSTALEVAIGRHSADIVVSTDDIAEKCIKFLKEKKIGRARFLPLNKIRGEKKKSDGTYVIDLIEFDKKFYPALEYVLGSTAVVDDIEAARKKTGRIVTLDGDLIESYGAMIGGYYEKRFGKVFGSEKIKEENKKLLSEISAQEKELKELKSREEVSTEEIKKLDEERSLFEKDIENSRIKRRELYDEKLILQNSISKHEIEKAKVEANAENLKLEFEEYKDVKDFFNLGIEELQENVTSCVTEINKLGPINMKAIDEYNIINIEFEELKKKLDKLLEERTSIVNVIEEVEKRRYDKFMETLTEISKNFSRIYKDSMNGFGRLRLEIENDIDSGMIIEASPAGKKVLSLDSMSGGEKTITSLAFLFAIMEYYSAPFYVLDEVDAALDKANTKNLVDLLKKYSKERQFIVITHNDFTIQEADKVFGVSMEDGISKVFGIELPKR